MGKKIKTTKQRLKYRKKNRNTKRKYKKQNTKLIHGGDPKDQQNRCINSIFERIQTYENIEVLRNNMKGLCLDYKTNILDNPPYEFDIDIQSFIVTSMLIPYMIQENIYNISNAPYTEFNQLLDLYNKNVYFGKEIKQHHLTSLTPYPSKSLELLNSCKDEEEYCIMDPKYLIIDSQQQVTYLCNSENIDEIIRIKGNTDLSKTESGNYLYCILPDKTLCIFKGHHSSGACGQPIICAGNIVISDQKITQIDNSSGHYSPPKSMLLKALEILETNGLVMKDTKKYNDLSHEIAKITFADSPTCQAGNFSIFGFCM
jgi:hypothetical protein